MDAKNQDNSVVDSKNQDPANGELKDSELAGVTGGTTNIVQLAKMPLRREQQGLLRANASPTRASVLLLVATEPVPISSEIYLQQVPMKPDHLCRVGKGARAESLRLSCELDRARRAHAVGCQWWARRAKRAFAHPTIPFERDAP
jgi:hypothetical protein